MRTARVTILATPDEKISWDARAAEAGVSTGEFVRLAVSRERDEGADADSEAALQALAAELEAAVPEMAASLDRSLGYFREGSATIRQCLADMDAREAAAAANR